MDTLVVEFVSALRSRGVRVSLAESADSLRAIEAIGVWDRQLFKNALKATLIKEPADVPTFEQLFPMFFHAEAPPPLQPQGLTQEQQEQLENAAEEDPRSKGDDWHRKPIMEKNCTEDHG